MAINPNPSTDQSRTMERAQAQRRNWAIKGAFYSEVIDMFDIYLPAVVLSPVLGYFQPPEVEPANAVILGSLVFITTLLGRPLGAVVFGLIADHTGRRKASIYSVVGFSVITLLIAFIPGYQSIGISSYVLLVTLRVLDGICLGGGYTGAHPLALESSKKHQRGLVGGLIMSGFCVAYVAINLAAIAMFAVFPLNGSRLALRAMGLAHPLRIWCSARRCVGAVLPVQCRGHQRSGHARSRPVRQSRRYRHCFVVARHAI